MRIIVTIFLIIIFNPANASNIRDLESKMTQCAGVFMILTAHPDAGFNQAIMPWAMASSEFAGILAKEGGRSVTRREVNIQRDAQSLQIAEIWDRNSASAFGIVDECDAWFRGIVEKLRIIPDDERSIKQFFLSLPIVAQEANSPEKKRKLMKIFNEAMKNWTEMGRVTATGQSDKVRRQIEENIRR